MKKRLYKFFILWLGLIVLSGCEEPYLPHVLESPNRYLVVNGFINASGTTRIALSYTQSIYDGAVPDKEIGAVVEIEAENGPTIILSGAGDGVYSAANVNFTPGKKCRLKINTSNGKVYISDFVEVKASPPIDKISWKPENDGIQIAVSARDPRNATRYYSWDAEETWEFRTPYRSFLEYKDGIISYNPFMEDISICWKTQPIRNILIGTSAKLSQDVINEQPISKIPKNSNKVEYKYSIIVRQYAQTKEGYEYLYNLKRNTENIGTLFDPQPSQLSGNIIVLQTHPNR